jgi:hypothetical protein
MREDPDWRERERERHRADYRRALSDPERAAKIKSRQARRALKRRAEMSSWRSKRRQDPAWREQERERHRSCYRRAMSTPDRAAKIRGKSARGKKRAIQRNKENRMEIAKYALGTITH